MQPAPEEDSDHEKTETEDEKPSDKKTSKKIDAESSGTKGKEDKQASSAKLSIILNYL